MKKLLKICDWIEEIVAGVFLLMMLAITVVNVASRYIFHASFSFADEITTYSFVLVTLLGAAIAAKRREHLGLSILTDRVSPAARRILLIIGFGFGTAFALCIFIYGILMVKSQILLGQVTAAMQWPEWVFGSFVPIGSFFVVIRFLQAMIEEIRKSPEDEVVVDPGEEIVDREKEDMK
ncbi:MAG: TRAP transporter small permease [Eubacterium sp.]|jgi:C4-dicarboxylate transporter DctQ subunit|uniref:TRAP transporter small permease n=1 Tax=Eubacterium sp. F2 TaxID=3381348 RepID=UPI0039082237|nr:TRAP transporter small permease [Eubacterium sp.]